MHVQVAGFSGTNDNEPLLPLTVQAMASADTHIQATDARMLCTLARPGKCSVIPLCTPKRQKSSHVQDPVWNKLLDLAVEQKASALIDAGAYLSLHCLRFSIKFLSFDVIVSASGQKYPAPSENDK